MSNPEKTAAFGAQPLGLASHAQDSSDGLEVVVIDSGLEVVPGQYDSDRWKSYRQTNVAPSHDEMLDEKAGATGQCPDEGLQISGQPEYGLHELPPASERTASDRICGCKRRYFWIILAVAILSVILAIALGVPLGIVSRNKSRSARYAGVWWNR